MPRPSVRRLTLLLVCVGWWLACPPAAAAGTILRVVLRDGATGKPTPAMVSITGRGGEVRLPPDGRKLEEASTVAEWNAGFRASDGPGWIGPVRDLAKGYPGMDRAGALETVPAVPHWGEPVMFQVGGEFTIDLPQGSWRLAASRGQEYAPVVEEFEVGGTGAITKTLALERWVDLPRRGWWSGDVHVHHPTVDPANREFLLSAARASDLHVVNLLEMGHHWLSANDFKQAGFGKKFRVRRGNYCLVSGQEDPRGLFGHVIGLNIRRYVRDLATYDWYDLAFERIHEQEGAVVGFGHFAVHWTLMNGFPWWVTTGEIDYVELLQFGRINTLDYYDYLNLGFRLTAAAGSDVPFGAVMGEVRTYVHTGPDLDVDAWFENLRRGRSFVSNGPALEFTVDGKLPGSELARKAGESVALSARAWGHPAICVPRALSIVGNDGVIAEAENPGKESALSLSLKRKIEGSQWLVAGTICENGAVAHSSPVYVIVGGRPHWSAARGPAIIEKQLAAIDEVRSEHAEIDDERSRGLVERLDRARAYYEKLRERMKK